MGEAKLGVGLRAVTGCEQATCCSTKYVVIPCEDGWAARKKLLGDMNIPDFIESDEKLAELLKPTQENEIPILLGCVDNNRSRQMCHRVFQTLDSLVYIDSGNGEYTGQVVCGVRKNGRTKLNSVCHFYPEMLTGSDKFKSEESCSDAIVSSPQNIMANVMAATILLSYLKPGLIYNYPQ